nr:hypothetical protein [Tanacetum cinerariifolium]
MSEEGQNIDVGPLLKFDMPLYSSEMTAKDVKSLALRHAIPLDLHLVALTKEWTMDQLPKDMIGLYEQYFKFSGIRVPFSAFLLAVIKHFRVHISHLVPLGLNRMTMFELYCRSLDGFNTLDVPMLTEQVVDLRLVPSGLLFLGGLATTWEFLGFHPVFKDIEGNGQNIPAKTDHQKRVEVEDPKIVATRERKARVAAKKRRQGGDGGEGSRPKTKRKKTAARKDGPVASEATSSPEPLRTINPTGPFGDVSETVESRKDCSPRVSPHESANCSVHNYSDTHVNEGAGTLRLGTFRDPSGRAMTSVNTEVVRPSQSHQSAYHSPVATRLASPTRSIQRVESSRRGSFYVPDWSIHQRCRLDTPAWCRELMVHLAPLAAQEESNALNNANALKRAWFSLARGALAQTNIFERFEHLQGEFDKLAETHAECGKIVRKLVQASQNDEPSQANRDQASRIRQLEDELARKDSALVYAERLNAERAQETEKLVTQLSKTEIEKFEYIRKLLPTISRGFRHFVSDLIKVYPDSPSSKQVPPSEPFFRQAASTTAPQGS